MEVRKEKIELFCDLNPCAISNGFVYDLGILQLQSPTWDNLSTKSDENIIDDTEITMAFVGYGIRLPNAGNYNLKQITSIRLTECEASISNDHSLCSNLSDSSPNPCHKDSGGPLYTVSDAGTYSLRGIATGSGVGCRIGQAIYNDTTNPEIRTWLDEHTDKSKNRCLKSNLLSPTEIFSEPKGWLDEASQYRELDIEVTSGFDVLLITMNHAPGESSGAMQNDFDLELFGPSDSDNIAASLQTYCDNTWKLLSICRVPSPTGGTWKARVTRKYGEGHFQLVASGISR